MISTTYPRTFRLSPFGETLVTFANVIKDMSGESLFLAKA
jgi:hypothetical protein